MVSLLWGFRKDPELTTKHQTTPLTCLFSHFILKDKFMYLPHLSALLPNLLLLWYFQSLLRVSMSTAIRVRNLGAVLGTSFLPLHHGQRLASFPASIPSLSHCSQHLDFLRGITPSTPYLLCGLGRIYPAPSPDGGP